MWMVRKAKTITVHKIELPPDEQPGAFMNQDLAMLMHRVDSIYVEDGDVTMNIQYLCSCGLPVYELLGKDLEFGCQHCDSTCVKHDCEQCKTLMSVDYGAEERNEDL
jgi:hypothetical protein